MNGYHKILDKMDLNDTAKERISENLATRLEKQEKGSASRTWGVAFTSKRVRAVAAIAFSAALVTAVAVPVGIYYGGSSIYYGFQLSDTAPDNSGVEPTAAPAPYLCAYRLAAKTWNSRKSVPITVYYGILEGLFYFEYGLYDHLSDDVHGEVAQVELYFYVFNSIKEAVRIENPYRGLEDMEAGDIDGTYYLYKVERYNRDEWREIFDKYSLNIKFDAYSLSMENEKIQFPHSEKLTIPNEIMSSGSSKLYFDFAGKMTYDDGFVRWNYSGSGGSRMISLNYRKDNRKISFSSPD